MIKPILIYPNSLLKKPSNPLNMDGNRLQDPKFISALLVDMFDSMRAAKGIGLAAVQIGVPVQLIIVDSLKEDGVDKPPVAMVNPSITSRGGTIEAMQEGCLSFPGLLETVNRNTEVTVNYFSPTQGRFMETIFKGQRAHVAQHEIEHLEGMLLTDRMTKARRGQVLGELRKYKRTHRSS